MTIGKAVDGAVIVQARAHRRRQASLVDTPGEIAEQVTDGGFQRRLRQHEVREMIHDSYYKSVLTLAAIDKI